MPPTPAIGKQPRLRTSSATPHHRGCVEDLRRPRADPQGPSWALTMVASPHGRQEEEALQSSVEAQPRAVRSDCQDRQHARPRAARTPPPTARLPDCPRRRRVPVRLRGSRRRRGHGVPEDPGRRRNRAEVLPQVRGAHLGTNACYAARDAAQASPARPARCFGHAARARALRHITPRSRGSTRPATSSRIPRPA